MIIKNKNWKHPKVASQELDLLERLSNASAVSGNEGAVRKIVMSEIKNLADDIQIDSMGNVLVTKRGKGNNLPKVMLAAHMDEVGFMITSDDGDGLFGFTTVGGINTSYLAGIPVLVGDNQINGVIGLKPIHLTTVGERKNKLSVSSLKIDLGPGNKSKAKIGDWATFANKFNKIGPSLRGKALDDRIGITSLITLLRNAPKNIDFMAAFTVQEEIGLRGAQVAGYTLNPDIAIALDCTPAMDLPMWDDSENTLYRTKINQGPAIYVADGGTLADPRLVRHLKSVGDTYNIPYQLRQPGGGRTDASAIQLQRGGIPSISVSVPGRYLHTPASIVRHSDWKNSIALIHASLSHFDKSILKGERK